VPVIATPGDQLVSVSGLPTGLKRPSMPIQAYYGGGLVRMVGDGRAMSYTQLYREQVWIAVAVNKLTRQISRLPLKVYTRDSQNNRVRQTEHPLAQLLEKPFPRGGPTHLKQKVALPALLHGNALLAKLRPGPGAPPTSFMPLDWRYVIPHGAAGLAGDFIPGEVEFWEFTYPDERRIVEPGETLHFKWDSPDSALGVSPLQQLGVTVQSEDAAQRYTAASLQNGVRPSGALVLPPDARNSREAAQQIKQEVMSANGGVDNAMSLLVMGGGVDFKPFGQTTQEAQLIETRKINREEVAAVYDIPQSLIGILDHATYSNITEQHLMLYQTVLGPWLTMIEETIKAQLIDPEPAWEGLFVEFDIGEQLKGNPIERSKAQALWVTHGIYTINEVRKMENLPRVENPMLDQPMIPVNNMAPATSLNPQEEQTVPGEQEPTSPDLLPVLASHLARAAQQVRSKAGAGAGRPFDRDRFEREYAADLEPTLGARGAAEFAGRWGAALDALVDHAAGDTAALKASFQALATPSQS
jgi:HK97 family phage portal protein